MSPMEPKMKKYIFGDRNGVHIIDLQKTVKKLKEVLAFVEYVVANRVQFLCWHKNKLETILEMKPIAVVCTI